VPTRLELWGARLLAGDIPSSFATKAVLSSLAGCAALYDIGLEAYLSAERIGLRRRTHLPVPTVSIGNLTVGGTGKTPMTQLLCRTFAAQGRRAAVLSRGHGGAGQGVRIVSDGQGTVLLGAEDAGDEPLLLARTLPSNSVLVGKDRRESGREALRRFAPDALVLDDGFQFWQLGRELDIVLLDARRPFDNGWPLPRGLLREPKRHLRRAQMVVVTRSESLDSVEREQLQREISRLAPRVETYWARHAAQGFVPAANLAGALLPLNALRGQRIVALSGIAQPGSFARSLTEDAYVEIVHHLIYPDHARYGLGDVAAVNAAIEAKGAAALVMTEKDAVKWPHSPALSVPVYALRTAMQVEDEARWAASVMRRLFGQT